MSITNRIASIENHLEDAYDAIELKGANLHLLPSEYTQVDYIESSGTQYINTGVNADTNLRVLMDIAYTDLVQDNQNIGAIKLQSGNNNARYHLLLDIVHNTMRVWLNNSNYTFGDADTNRHIYDINPVEGYAKCDDNQITIPTNIINTELNFYLFGRNSTSTIYMAKIKQWACKMYYNNELVRDFIPCYRNSDNEVGLYDLVNDTFYTNQGTGAFTYGEVKEDYAFAKNISNLSRAINLIPTD